MQTTPIHAPTPTADAGSNAGPAAGSAVAPTGRARPRPIAWPDGYTAAVIGALDPDGALGLALGHRLGYPTRQLLARGLRGQYEALLASGWFADTVVPHLTSVEGGEGEPFLVYPEDMEDGTIALPPKSVLLSAEALRDPVLVELGQEVLANGVQLKLRGVPVAIEVREDDGANDGAGEEESEALVELSDEDGAEPDSEPDSEPSFVAWVQTCTLSFRASGTEAERLAAEHGALAFGVILGWSYLE